MGCWRCRARGRRLRGDPFRRRMWGRRGWRGGETLQGAAIVVGVIEVLGYCGIAGFELEDLIGMGIEEGAEALAFEVGQDFVTVTGGEEQGVASSAGVGGDDDGMSFSVEKLDHANDQRDADGGM